MKNNGSVKPGYAKTTSRPAVITDY